MIWNISIDHCRGVKELRGLRKRIEQGIRLRRRLENEDMREGKNDECKALLHDRQSNLDFFRLFENCSMSSPLKSEIVEFV